MKTKQNTQPLGSLFGTISPFTTDAFLTSFFKDDFWDVFDSLNKDLHYPVDSYWDKDRNYIMEVPLAGYKRDNITLKADHDYLTLNVSKRDKTPDVTYRDDRVKKKAITLKWFLNDTFDKTKITSSFEDGLLKITLPLKVVKDNTETLSIAIN